MRESVVALITTAGKNKESLRKLITSICQEVFYLKRIIIIYDCVSFVHSEIFQNCNLPVVLMANKERIPLTQLQNQAISDVKEKFILMFNDDIILDKNFIKELISVMESNSNIGIACGKIKRADKCTIDSAGQFLGENRIPQERGYGQLDKGQFDNQEFVFGACGAAVLYRKKMLDEIAISPGEYFDKDYHMFYEDLDISWRASNFGWKTFYNPKAVCYHVRGATAKSKKPKFKSLEKYNFAWLETHLKSDLIKNRYMTIIKNDKFKDYLAGLPHILLYDLKLWMYCLIFEPYLVVCFFKQFPYFVKALKKRKILVERIRTR